MTYNYNFTFVDYFNNFASRTIRTSRRSRTFTKKRKPELLPDSNDVFKGCWSITASKSELDGDNIVLHDVVIKLLKVDEIGNYLVREHSSDKSKDETGSATPDEGKFILKGSPLLTFEKIDNITFEKVNEDQAGNFFARKLSIPMLKYEAAESKLIATDIAFENIKLASEKNKALIIANFPYERASFKRINWTHDSNTIILYFDALHPATSNESYQIRSERKILQLCA